MKIMQNGIKVVQVFCKLHQNNKNLYNNDCLVFYNSLEFVFNIVKNVQISKKIVEKYLKID